MSGVGQCGLFVLLYLLHVDAFHGKDQLLSLYEYGRVRGAACGSGGGAGAGGGGGGGGGRGAVALAVGVSSALRHGPARRVLRDTWARHAARLDVAYAFVLGTPTADLAEELSVEADQYNDLVFGAFKDTYRNLTLKSLALMEWATGCQRARWLLKTDDDVFVNIIEVVKFVSNLERSTDNNTIYGKVREDMPVDRERKSRYYVSYRQYGYKVFPGFCRGLGYLMPLGAARRLLAAAPRLPYIPLEDVFLTGLVADVVGIRRENIDSFRDEKEDGPPPSNESMLVVHTGGNQRRMRALWKMVKNNN